MKTEAMNMPDPGVVSREEYDKLLSDYQHVCFQLAELKRMLFGSKSERFHSKEEDPLQLDLFALQAQPESLPEENQTVSPMSAERQRNAPRVPASRSTCTVKKRSWNRRAFRREPSR